MSYASLLSYVLLQNNNISVKSTESSSVVPVLKKAKWMSFASLPSWCVPLQKDNIWMNLDESIAVPVRKRRRIYAVCIAPVLRPSQRDNIWVNLLDESYPVSFQWERKSNECRFHHFRLAHVSKKTIFEWTWTNPAVPFLSEKEGKYMVVFLASLLCCVCLKMDNIWMNLDESSAVPVVKNVKWMSFPSLPSRVRLQQSNNIGVHGSIQCRSSSAS